MERDIVSDMGARNAGVCLFLYLSLRETARAQPEHPRHRYFSQIRVQYYTFGKNGTRYRERYGC